MNKLESGNRMMLNIILNRVRLKAILFLLLFLWLSLKPLQAEWGERGMVASEHELASEAGVEILKKGGNVVDSAVATSFALGVVNPSSCGIGGGGFMLIHLTQEGKTYALDYREKAPAAASRNMFIKNGKADTHLSQKGSLAIAVPGEVAGLTTALKRFGTLPLPVVMEPAIRYAREGYPVGAHLAKQIGRNTDRIGQRPALAKIFLKPDGTPYREGERLVWPELAETLEVISQKGSEAFYQGEISRVLIQTMEQEGGLLTASDLRAYKPVWRQALIGHFQGYTILTMPPPAGGGVLLEMLNILSGDKLKDLGLVSPTYLHLLAETMKHAFADRAEYYGDPDFIHIPLDTLLSSSYTQGVRHKISAVRTKVQEEYGRAALSRNGGTSHFSVVDGQGNAVACTTTINTTFGSMVVAEGTGVILNNEMDDFSIHPGTANAFGLIGSEANAITPGKKPLSSMTPTIVLKQDQPFLVLGGSGGPLITSATVQVLLNVLAFGVDPVQAVALPRIHHQWAPDILFVEAGLAQEARNSLEQRGHTVKEFAAAAAVQAVLVTPRGLQGAADPRKGGKAVGW
jgi:gamma-glutamyltranspeptidase/glutathione hydrolase